MISVIATWRLHMPYTTQSHHRQETILIRQAQQDWLSCLKINIRQAKINVRINIRQTHIDWAQSD